MNPPMHEPRTSLAAYCLSCYDPWVEDNQPQRNVTTNCKHHIETCRDCLPERIGNQLAESQLDEVECPSGGCKEHLGYKDIEEAVGHDKFEKCAKPSSEMPFRVSI